MVQFHRAQDDWACNFWSKLEFFIISKILSIPPNSSISLRVSSMDKADNLMDPQATKRSCGSDAHTFITNNEFSMIPRVSISLRKPLVRLKNANLADVLKSKHNIIQQPLLPCDILELRNSRNPLEVATNLGLQILLQLHLVVWGQNEKNKL